MSAANHARIATLAATRAVHRAFGWLHLHEPQIRRWQLESIAIPAPPFGEADRARYYLERFTALGLQQPHIDAEGNALAEISVGAGGPVVLLSAHLDTVFPAATNVAPQEDEARILAPGATDNAAGLAALLAIAAAMQHAELVPACTILFAANVGEEGEGDLRGMRHLFDPARSPYASRIRAAIAFEGAGAATVVDRALGSRRLRVTVAGPGGHSWADAGRPNAILGLAAALVAVSRIALPRNPRTTLNIGTIAGGTSVNTIAAAATADIDIRSTTAMQLDRFELTLLKTLEVSLAASGLGLHAERIGNREPGVLPETAQLHRSLRAVDRHLNIATQSRIGSTDANLPLSRSVPALAIGAGGTGGGMHTLEEWYDPTGRDLALRRALLLLLDTCTTVGEAGIRD